MSFVPASDALQSFLSKVALRSELTDAERDAVLGLRATPRQVTAHEEIVRLGERVDHACLIAEGFVARFAQLQDGARQNVSVHIAGDLVDLYSLMLPAVPTPLVALTATTILQIPHAALRDLAFRYPGIAAAFWRECVIDGGIVAQWLVNVGRRDARGRFAHLLCELAVRSFHAGRYERCRFALPLTQEQLADVLGLTAVHVNRTLRTLRDEGLVLVSSREATILDWDGLSAAAEFDPTYLHLPELPRLAKQVGSSG